MTAVCLSERLNAILEVVHSRDFSAQQISDDQADAYKARNSGFEPQAVVERCSFSKRHKLFVDSMKELKPELEKVIEKNILKPNVESKFVLFATVEDAVISLFRNLLKCFKERLPAIKLEDDGNTLLAKVQVGLQAGLRIINKVFLVLPLVMQEQKIELTKENFMQAAEASFEFIDELTKLSLGGITLVENFLEGGNIAILNQSVVDKVIASSEEALGLFSSLPQITPSLRQLLNPIHQGLQNMINDLLAKSIDQDQRFFKLDKFQLNKESKALTMSDEAIDIFQREANKQFVKLMSLTKKFNTVLFGVKGFKFNEVTNYCPARSVKVETSDRHSEIPGSKNLIRACFDRILKEIDKIPDLELVLKKHSYTYRASIK